MPKYTVTWGDESLVVEAANEADAWAEFCRSNELAARHPNAFARGVVEVEEKKAEVKAPAK